MKKIGLLATFIIFALSTVTGLADEKGVPSDYQKVSPDGKYVFVMLSPSESRFAEKDKTLRKKYRSSGLYKNDKSSTPLWKIDWYSAKQDIYLSSDGKHLVRMGFWTGRRDDEGLEKGEPAVKQLAVAFYNEGKLLKAYTIEDLIEKSNKIPPSVSYFRWKKEVSFDDATSQLSILTVEGKRYVFDVRSGEILTS